MAASRVDPAELIYRWDLDKTYLRTEFDTVLDLLRTAVEPAGRKRAFPAAAALMREQNAAGTRGLFILSGSPEQMRPVLETKLRMDGVRWDAFHLKPSLRNLVRGRLRFLRDQVGYKLGALLDSRATLVKGDGAGAEVLFGDDAEADAFVYSLYGDICAGRIDDAALAEILVEADAYPDQVTEILRRADGVRGNDVVRIAFIHLARVSPASTFEVYGGRVCPIYNYFQPACVLADMGALSAAAALRIGEDMLHGNAFGPDTLLASFLDMARRGRVRRQTAVALVDAAEGEGHRALSRERLSRFAEALKTRLDDLEPDAELADGTPPPVDYIAVLRRDREARDALRRRVMFRRRWG